MFHLKTCMWKIMQPKLIKRAYTTLPTIHDVRLDLMKIIGYDKTWGVDQLDKTVILEEAKKLKTPLQNQRMRDSYAEAIIPLEDETELRNKYANFQNNVRFGRLLEDLDTMAVHISYLHNKSQNINFNGKSLSPIVIVTVAVDQIQIKTPRIQVNKNIKLSGYTSWVGKSSSEVTMKLEQQIALDVWQPVLEAKFLVCARDALNKGSAIMNPLEITDDKEKAIFELGHKNKLLRQKESTESLFNMPPNNIESLLVHEMFRKTIDLDSGTLKVRVKPENTVWMEETILKNVIICHPEQRNLYNKIFGGFLMRQAYELAWINSSLYSKSTPKINVVDDITFKRPVLIGTLLFLTSQIVYTEKNQMQVKVHAKSVDPKTSQSFVTNDFYFIFEAPDNLDLPQVMPKTYAEAMMYIDGKRHMKV